MKCPSSFSRILIPRILILSWLRIENAALMKPWGSESSVPSERLSSSMDPWPHCRIFGAKIMAGSYDSNSNNGLLTCYGSPSDGALALHHPPHNGPRSTGTCLSDLNPGSTRSYDMFLDYAGYLLVALSYFELFTKTIRYCSGRPPSDAPNKWEIDVIHRLMDSVYTGAPDPTLSQSVATAQTQSCQSLSPHSLLVSKYRPK